ncbi:MAG: hypothetical protein ACRCX2_29840 [Paraclostridium sp.]
MARRKMSIENISNVIIYRRSSYTMTYYRNKLPNQIAQYNNCKNSSLCSNLCNYNTATCKQVKIP